MSVREETVDDTWTRALPEKLTTFLDLKKHLKPPRMKLDLIPVLDLMVLTLMISLLFTRYLMIPGVRVDLPKTEFSIQQNASSVAVLTISNGGMLFFAGSVYEQNSIGQAFQRYFDTHSAESPVLLVKAEASMDIQQFLQLCQMAQEAGFYEVQIAANPTAAGQGLTADSLSKQSNNVVFPVR